MSTTTSTGTGARAMEVVLLVGLVSTAAIGLMRTVLSPVWPLHDLLPAWLHHSQYLPAGFFSRSPHVRVELGEGVRVTTDPPLYTFGGEEIPAGRGEMSGPFEAQVNVYDPTLGQELGLLGADLLVALTTVLVLLLLLRIVRTLRAGDPFIVANADRLRIVAVSVIAGGMGAQMLRSFGELQVLSDPVISPLVRQVHELSFLPLVAGAGVWLLAEVFRRGAAMRDDLGGLV